MSEKVQYKEAKAKKQQIRAAKQSEELEMLWGEAPVEKNKADDYDDDITPMQNRKRLYMRPRPEREVKKAKELVQNVGTEVVAPGASFNPDEEQRQAALREAYNRNEREIKEAEDLKAKLFPPCNIVENAFPEEDDESELLPPKKVKGPLTKAQKNARLKKIQDDFEKNKEKTQKKLNKQIDRLGPIIGSIKAEEKANAKEQERVKHLKETQNDRRAKLSKHEYVAPFPEVVLEDELEDRSLRSVKPSVNLVRDQFKSFQNKNIIETRVRVKGLKRRYKMTSYTRNSHKEENMKWNTRKKS